METTNKRVASVEEYLEALATKHRMALEKLRETIRSMVPDAEEVISYQIPTFKYKGGLVAYAAFKNHYSFFTMNNSLVKELGEELKGYDTTPSSIHFTDDKPLPEALIKKIVQARIKENEARLLAKQNKNMG